MCRLVRKNAPWRCREAQGWRRLRARRAKCRSRRQVASPRPRGAAAGGAGLDGALRGWTGLCGAVWGSAGSCGALRSSAGRPRPRQVGCGPAPAGGRGEVPPAPRSPGGGLEGGRKPAPAGFWPQAASCSARTPWTSLAALSVPEKKGGSRD